MSGISWTRSQKSASRISECWKVRYHFALNRSLNVLLLSGKESQRRMMKWLLIIAGIACVPFMLGMVAFGVFNSPRVNGVEAFDKSRSEQYYHDDHHVYYVQGGNFFELGKQLMEKADLNSFTVLSNAYAKDKHQVYFSGEAIPNADADSFELLLSDSDQTDSIYSRDQQQVFFFHQPIEGADAASYVNIGGGYGVDKQQFYYDGQPISVSAASYEYLGADGGHSYLAVEEHVYYQGKLLVGAVQEGFTVLENSFAKDKAQVFFYGKPVLEANAASFEVVNKWIQKDDQRIFFEAEPLPFGDPATVEDVDGYFWKDKDAVYEGKKRLLGVKPMWFGKTDADDFRAYKYQEVKIDEYTSRYVKRSKLDWLSDGYFIYEGAVFHHSQGRLNVESSNGAKVFGAGFEHWYIVLDGKAFFGNTVIEGADVSHFKPLGRNFSTDGKQIFWNTFPVVDVEPVNFNIDEAEYPEEGEDGRYYLKEA